MNTRPELSQMLKAAEYVYARGYGSYDKAADALEDAYGECEVSACERPRIVCYTRAGFTFWAIVLTDTSIPA